VPGGKCAEQSSTLGPAGRVAIRSFVAGGGGYIGICAGMFLAATDHNPYPSWQRNNLGLGLIRAATVKAHRPGLVSGNHAIVKVQLTKKGREMLWDEEKTWQEEPEELADGLVTHRYAGGPLYVRPGEEEEGQEGAEGAEEEGEEEEEIPAWVLAMSGGGDGVSGGGGSTSHAQKEGQGGEGEDEENEGEEDGDPETHLDKAALARLEQEMALLPAREDLPPYTELAAFLAETEDEQDALMGATAIAHAPYGDGLVITISTHPESTFPDEKVDPKWRPSAVPRLRRFIQRALLAVTNPGLLNN